MILGIDEVGRGPWAGPLVVGAVIMDEEAKQPASVAPASAAADISYLWDHLTDSKKLTPKTRNELNQLILKYSPAYGLGWVTAPELDQYGLARSLMIATRRAVKQVLAGKTKFERIVIDGTVNFLKNTPLEDRVTTFKKADLTVKAVSAASIIAKVARDEYMTQIATQYPVYGFEKHVGYGTALHRENLQKHGICPEHRQSFRPVKEIMAQFSENSPNTPLRGDLSTSSIKEPSTSQKGQTAELTVASYLREQNHRIIAHDFKSKTYEIDLISTKNQQIFFTEVKYSQEIVREGTALVRITPQKLQQMRFAAQAFLAQHSELQKFQPILAAAAVHGQDYKVENWLPLVD